MNRDNIKIIEFGMDDEGPSPARPSGGRDRDMKIVEVDNGPSGVQKRVATSKDVGHIKIIEFDEEPKTRTTQPPERARRPVGPLKIREFDKEEEAEAPEPGLGSPKIKIMEFD